MPTASSGVRSRSIRVEDKRIHRERRMSHSESGSDGLWSMQARCERTGESFQGNSSTVTTVMRQRGQQAVDVITGVAATCERIDQHLRNHLVVLGRMVVDRVRSCARQLLGRRDRDAHRR